MSDVVSQKDADAGLDELTCRSRATNGRTRLHVNKLRASNLRPTLQLSRPSLRRSSLDDNFWDGLHPIAQTDRALLHVTAYFAKSLLDTQGHSK